VVVVVVLGGCACWDGCCRPEAIAEVECNERDEGLSGE
jgi:hypothetical protein